MAWHSLFLFDLLTKYHFNDTILIETFFEGIMEEKMILYHGSRQIVKIPMYGIGKSANDYGQGFYCTESLELAREWACPVQMNGYANKYELDVETLSVLKLNEGDYHILNWLALLLKNRTFDIGRNKELALRGRAFVIEHFLPDTSTCDVIIGYRADDRYFAFAKDFIEGSISLRQLSQAMKLGKLGEQVVLISKKAFENIRFIEYEQVDSDIYYRKRMEREICAREDFDALRRETPGFKEDIFTLDIIRGGMTADDMHL